MIKLGSPPVRPAQARTHQHFMPYVAASPTVSGQGDGKAGQVKAGHVFANMIDHGEQGRDYLEWNRWLADAALDRCMVMAYDGWVGHIDPLGRGPNWWARELFDYALPDWYDKDRAANNIESLAWGGSGLVEDVWQDWMNSPGHRTHILGTDPFYAAQTQVGVGYYMLEGSEYTHYWCILSAPPEGE